MEIEWSRAICYSGYRKGQSPSEKKYPSEEQIYEDLKIIISHGFKYIRMYDANDYAESVCRVIQKNNLSLKLMLGPGLINEVNNTGCEWNKTIYSEEELSERKNYNIQQIKRLARIAIEYSDVVFAVSVGNENTPEWGENTVPEDRLIIYADFLKSITGKIVTFNEGAREWEKLSNLASHLDVICIHSYPLWYGLSLKDSLEANKEDYERIKNIYSNKQIIFSEVGWATSAVGNTQMLEGEATEENQAEYYKQFLKWTDSEKIIAFMFEAFDEPWKGGSIEGEAEKNWGIFTEERCPKKAVTYL